MPNNEALPEDPRIGPDARGDVRTHRPYYLVRLGDNEGQVENALQRILADIDADPNILVSDIVVFCHGWHRHGWQAMAVYDRLFSRIPGLLYSGRTSAGRRREYNPIYIGIHWSSDIDENTWSGNIGRRDQEEFKIAVRTRFPSSETNFDVLLDRYYFLFVDMAKRGRESLNDQDLQDQSHELWLGLNRFRASDNTHLEPEEKLSILWDCYTQSSRKGGDASQTTDPGYIVSPWRIDGWLGFILVVTFILYEWLGHLLWNNTQIPFIHTHWTLLGVLELVFVAALANISTTWLVSRQNEPLRDATRLSLFNQLSLLFFKLPGLLILLLWNLTSYVFGPSFNRAVYDEKLKSSNPIKGGNSLSLGLANLCLVPNKIWNWMLPQKKLRDSIISTIDSQCSFWQMQQKAVITGHYIASLLRRIFESREKELLTTRLHLVGHSFGGVAVSNAAFGLTTVTGMARRINSLCLLLPAISSSWFKDKPEIASGIQNTMSCVFSRYDRANGIWFPIANGRKLSAGFVGLSGIDNIRPETIPAVMIFPFHLNPSLQNTQKHLLNIDASHVMHEGPYFSGGHGHVFTDEAVYIVWSVTIGASVHIADLYPGAYPGLTNSSQP